jgi:hypothetical protein
MQTDLLQHRPLHRLAEVACDILGVERLAACDCEDVAGVGPACPRLLGKLAGRLRLKDLDRAGI